MDQIKNMLTQTIDLMEQNNRGVQLGCYSVALVGLTVAIRRVRPFTKFKKPSDVPNRFINERKEFTGLVERLDPNGGVLLINHKPLFPLPRINEGARLPVKISGVRVTGLGLNWLQTIVVGNEVKFVPIAKTSNHLHCEVLLPQKLQNNKQRVVNIGESLVKIGFGQVVDVDRPISRSKPYLVYCNRLLIAENYAIRKRLGSKYYLRQVWSAFAYMGQSLKRVYRHILRIPKMSTS